MDDYKEREEFYSADDARAMSPRRTSGEIDRMGDDARQALEQYVFGFHFTIEVNADSNSQASSRVAIQSHRDPGTRAKRPIRA